MKNHCSMEQGDVSSDFALFVWCLIFSNSNVHLLNLVWQHINPATSFCSTHFTKCAAHTVGNRRLITPFFPRAENQRPVRSAYQPPASSTFLSERTSHKQPAATSQQYSSLRTNQHQPSATSQPNRLQMWKITLV
jgi:hypothetical protein